MPAETHMSGEPISRGEIFVIVRERIVEVCAVHEDVVTADARFVEDLGADTTMLLDIIATLEDEFGERTVGIVIDDDHLVDLVTVADLLDVLGLQLGLEGA